MPDTQNTDSGPDSRLEEPSPKSQPVGDTKLDKVGSGEAGLSGVSHDENPPTAPDTGAPSATEDAKADMGSGEGSGSGKKKMGERIKEKLHIGRSKDKS